jgi:DNA polymerase
VKLYIDIETRSRQDLKTVGVYRYTECPDFRILMAAWAHDDGPITTAVGEGDILAIPGLFDPEVEKVAHNAQFERVCFSRLDGTGWLDAAEWRDTMALAAEYGHPLSLNGLARALGAPPKDDAGSKLIRLFCMPRRDGGWNDETTHPMEWLDFIAYCEQDVDTLREVDRRVGKWPTAVERRVWEADQRINDNGMQIDLEMARLAERASIANTKDMMQESVELTGLDNPNSIQQLGRWLREQDSPLPNLRAETVEEALAGDLPDRVRRVLELRLDLALASSSKYATGLATVSPDGRVRGGFRFFGAHTGRWSGRGLQPQNLPRLAFKTEAETEAAILDLKMGLGADPQTLKKLIRPLFLGPFTVVDYAAIEARVIAWLAGEEWALGAFRAGRDIYVETAERMGGLTRAQGKVAVLALGYNGAVNSLRAMGAEGDDADLLALVVAWRRANRNIVKMWSLLEDAIEEGGQVGRHIRVSRHGSTMKIHLPSGRAIHYHHVRHGKYTVEDAKTGKTIRKEGWRYANPRGGGNIGTYGGRLAENVTQAVARDLMAEALVRLHDRGYTVAAHVHDEILVEGEHDVAEIAKIMCELPDWAEGLPVDGEGFVCQRYRKG